MNIAVIGAAGKAGSRITHEALQRGHQVTAIVRHPEKLEEEVPFLQKDIFDLTKEDLQPFDAVINAFAAPLGKEELHVTAGRRLIDLLSGEQEAPRLMVVGGAGSLYTDGTKTVRVMDADGFPAAVYPTSSNQAKNLEDLQQAKDLNWTFISPSANFALGKRTGLYQTGDDTLLVNSEGKSYVSYEDFAAAFIDELEHPQHFNKRFTVVSELH
ncbi:MAG: NAD(P)-dependent oxidoreductase [Sporolactobacillus sp.]